MHCLAQEGQKYLPVTCWFVVRIPVSARSCTASNICLCTRNIWPRSLLGESRIFRRLCRKGETPEVCIWGCPWDSELLSHSSVPRRLPEKNLPWQRFSLLKCVTKRLLDIVLPWPSEVDKDTVPDWKFNLLLICLPFVISRRCWGRYKKAENIL